MAIDIKLYYFYVDIAIDTVLLLYTVSPKNVRDIYNQTVSVRVQKYSSQGLNLIYSISKTQ